MGIHPGEMANGAAGGTTPSWAVIARGQVYGPYPLEQMKGFIAEGRVRPASLVADPDGAKQRPASEDPRLAPLFVRSRVTAFAEPVQRAEPARHFGRHEDVDTGALGHFIVIADMKTAPIAALENAIGTMGQIQPLTEQSWLLTTSESLNEVRTTLMRKLGRADTLFVVDTSRDKAAWFNYGPEGDARIRRVWTEVDRARAAAR